MGSKANNELDRLINTIESKWAKKRGKSLPLSIADQMQWEQERFIEQCFQQSKDLYSKSNKLYATSKDDVAKGFAPKFYPFSIRDGAIVHDKRYNFMSETDAEKAKTDIIGAFDEAACNSECHTMFSLLSKHQFLGDGLEYGFSRAAIILSPSLTHSNKLYVSNEDEIAAFLYAGLVTFEDNPQNAHRKGILEVKDKNMQSHAVELEGFCVLAEIEENASYLFTLFSRTRDLLFTVPLSGLKGIELVAEKGEIVVVEKGHEVNASNSDSDYIGQTFGKLTVIKVLGKNAKGQKKWLFQCSCGNTTESTIGNVKHGLKKSCGCLLKETRRRFKDIKGHKFGRLTAVKCLERKDNNGKYLWDCICDCGGTKTVSITSLSIGYVKSCGCLQKEVSEKKKLDIKGQKFGRLTTIEPIEESNKWLFQCSCGDKTKATASAAMRGKIRSCGCLRKERAIRRATEVRNQLIIAEGTNVSKIASDKLNTNNSSGVKGVYWNNHQQKWTASITCQGKRHHLGTFDDIANAALTRKAAEKKYHQPIIEKYMGN